VDTFEALGEVTSPVNEPVHDYAPGSPERRELEHELQRVRDEGPIEMPLVIAGVHRMASGSPMEVVEPHAHHRLLGMTADATEIDVAHAVEAALAAAPTWRATPFHERAAIFLRAAELLSGPWRARLNAATMLGQSKTAFQAEIDAACEFADFLRFNVADAAQLYQLQPRVSPQGVLNELDHRPLEGFVLAITPFNFTAIAANLPTAPALLGNTVVWKPSPTQQLAATRTMQLLETAGLPPGVINMVTGNGAAVSEVALVHPMLAGVHFTGSTGTFRHIWRTVAENLDGYRSYPRLIGETGGKDFVLAHSSADLDPLVTALVRGAFDYQGQKCSAASRAYLPQSLAPRVLERLGHLAEGLPYGDVTDLKNFGGAVIDRRSFNRLSGALARLRSDEGVRIVAGGTADDTEGYFVRPTVAVVDDPRHEVMATEFFGPILTVFVYPDERFDEALHLVDTTSPYALTGAVFATDRAAVEHARTALRYAAGNFYINDKPTGAVVGQQPFGGSRASGTNDKAGSILNLERWISPRTIKETFVPPTNPFYPHQG
jgi:1-pyrroline-5-carboxylate dehydrogenase